MLELFYMFDLMKLKKDAKKHGYIRALLEACFMASLVGVISCQTTRQSASRDATGGAIDGSSSARVQFSPGELDEVPAWAEEARALCLVGHVESCETVARDKSQVQLEAEWLEDQRERKCRAEHANSQGVYQGPRGSCLDGSVSLKGEVTDPDNETRAQREARLQREGQRQREKAYQKRWYGRAIASIQRSCELAKQADTQAECDEEELELLLQISRLDLADDAIELQTFAKDISTQRVRMKEACKKGHPDPCWRWFLTYTLDENPGSNNKHALLFQALSAGSSKAWVELAGLANGHEQPLPTSETREEILEAYNKERKAYQTLMFVFENHHDPVVPEKLPSAKRFTYKACTRGGDMGACYSRENFARMHHLNKPKREKRALALHQQAIEHCESKGEGYSCWVAGFAMEFQADDLVMAQDAYTRGCAMKSPRSCYGLGRSALRRGELARAAVSFERACALEYQPGCVMLGAHHAVGAGTPKDNVLARRLLEPACDTALEGSPRESACALLEWLP